VLFISLLERIGTLDACRVLEGLLKSPQRDVKKRALMALIGKDFIYLKKAFQFIEDEDSEIRKVIFECIAKKRNQVREDLLIAYIKGKDFMKKEPDHILKTFKALGLCGSSRSIPFLRELLMKKTIFMKGKYETIRLGTALALKYIGTSSSIDILKEGLKSKVRSIRDACRAVLMKEVS
jgi:HEAT repeat protein